MHGPSRLGRPPPPPPPPPPPASGRWRWGAGKAGAEPVCERVLFVLLSAVFRRRWLLLSAPLLYFGTLLYMGSISLESAGRIVDAVRRSPPRGSSYRSPEVFRRLWPELQSYGNTNETLMNAWHWKEGPRWKPCISKKLTRNEYSDLPASNGYLIIEANGGLNQQRISICDAVAASNLLNATLLIPMFHFNSVWRDSSKFGEIFDEEFFVNSLKKHVRIVKELPEDILLQFDNNISSIVNLRLKGWLSSNQFLQKVLPKLQELSAVRIAPFSNRLAHAIPSRFQALRCLANYEALRFADPIRILGEKMVERMISKSSKNGGKYISIHLRFEKDMVAFSCCTYDGGEEEKREMDVAREKGWRGKFNKTGRIIKPGVIRMDGKCPLTPLEVGMMLRGMGFDNMTTIYVAAGAIYKADKYMAPLRQLFPLLETKESIASADELAPFKGHSSRMAALDYTVCLHSEVFVTTQGGNFPHFLMGHRRYIYGGHAKSLLPDKRKLAKLFDNPRVKWDTFKHQMKEMLEHSDSKGFELRKPDKSVYTFPIPDCMCQEQHSHDKG